MKKDDHNMKKKKLIISISTVVICSIVGIIIAVIIKNNNPKCPSEYDYDEYTNMCIKMLKVNATITKDAYGRKTVSCPNGYTTNKTGVPGLEVPQFDVPGVTKKCYKKITMPPHK